MINTLFTGDNLYILNGMDSETVDLIYLDPPFNSKRTYSAPVGSKSAGASFKDMWTWKDVDEAYLERMVNDYPYLVHFIESIEVIHGKAMMSYITFMTQRILELHRVLKPTGSFYLHCDPTASHYLKIVLDRVFGRDKFVNEIIWNYNKWTNTAKYFQRNHDVILMYCKSKKYNFNKIYGEPTERQIQLRKAGYNTGSSSGRKIVRIYDKNNPKVIKKLQSGEWENRAIYYVESLKGNPIPDVWLISSINGQATERTGYPTQKPLALLRRIIKASSNEGDIVLDPFCGCATAMVAAQQLNRKWIGIDIEAKASELVVDRLSSDAGMFADFIHRLDIPIRTDVEIEDFQDTKNKKKIKERLSKDFGKICNACGMDHYENLEIDHILPRSKGGQDTYSNYQLLCGNCNRLKGNRPMEYLLSKIAKREEHLKKKITFGGIRKSD